MKDLLPAGISPNVVSETKVEVFDVAVSSSVLLYAGTII